MNEVLAKELKFNSKLLSAGALDNYLKLDNESENFISSYNEFTGKAVCFELPKGNGPQIIVNTNPSAHVQIDGTLFTVPTGSDFGPGQIQDNVLVKSWSEDGTTVSSELFATRKWTKNKIDVAVSNKVDSSVLANYALSSVVDNRLARKADVDELNNYVDKRTDNSVSGNFEVYKSVLSVTDGNVVLNKSNYVQSNNALSTKSYSYNSFLQAESEDRYGPAYTGTKGFCILSILKPEDSDSEYTNAIKLSGDLSALTRFMSQHYSDVAISSNDRSLADFSLKEAKQTNCLSDAFFSIALGPCSGSMRLQIESVDENTGIVKFRDNQLDVIGIQHKASWLFKDSVEFTSADYIDLFEHDDNSFYLVGFPELGNIELPNTYAQHAEGGSVRAIGKFTHAEGRDTIADARYSHAEGSHTAAGDMASHAEGFRTYAAKRFSHAEGEFTKAMGAVSHAAGLGATATGNRSYVWNGKTPNDTTITEDITYDLYVQPDGSGNGAFCINPQKGIDGFYIGNQSLQTYLSDLSNSIETQHISPIFMNAAQQNYKSFEDAVNVSAYINVGSDAASGNKWNNVGNGQFVGKIIEVSPGDVVTYKKMPRTSNSYYTTVIKPLSSFNYTINTTTNSVDGSTLTGFAPVDMSFAEDSEASAYWQDERKPNSVVYPAIILTSWTDENLKNREYEVTLKVPKNTHYLYVTTKYQNVDQPLESFKINGCELIGTKNLEKSVTVNAFNANSKWNLINRSLTSDISGYYTAHNGNYIVTHCIPCKYGDQIILSETKPYDRGASATPRYIYARSVEYLDKNFNRLYASCRSDTNNGFNATNVLTAENIDRKSVVLVHPIQYKECAYVRLGIPRSEYENTMIQIVHMEEYPKYTLKEHLSFVPFQKKYTQDTTSEVIKQFEGKKIAFFGDSITRTDINGNDFPSQGKNNVNRSYDAVMKGYVQYLAEDMHCSYVNAGNGGDTAALSSHTGENLRNSLADRLATWNSGGFPASISAEMQNIDVAFVMIGTNDWAYSWTPFGDVNGTDANSDTFCGAIRSICNKLTELYNNKIPIIFCTPIKRKQQDGIIDYTTANNIGKTLEDYANAIKTICNTYTNVYAIDLYNICLIDPLSSDNVKYIPDGTHPSSIGHNVIAKCILSKLQQIADDYYKKADPIYSLINC